MTEAEITHHEQLISGLEALVNGDLSKRDVLAESIEWHNPGLPGGVAHGREEVVEYIREIQAAFPDLRFTIDEILAEDDVVMIEITLTGTHEGEFQGIPPTGREVEIRGMEKYLVSDGQLAEGYVYYDRSKVPAQLGLTFPEVLGQLPKLAWGKLQSSR